MSDHAHVPAAKLKRHHFEQSPVWAYCLEAEGTAGADESSVRPADASEIARGSYGEFLVAATYTLRGKQSFPGAVQIDALGGEIVAEPAFVFLLDRHLEPISTQTDRLLSRYTQCPGNTPKRWALNLVLPHESKPRSAGIRKTFGFHLASLVVSLAMSVLKRRLQRQRGGEA